MTAQQRPVGEVRHIVHDFDGSVFGTHCRRYNAAGEKERVWWVGPDGEPGLGGRHPADVLYGGELLADRPGEALIMVEGEPAKDALEGLGFLVNATVTGAGTPLAPKCISAIAAGHCEGRPVFLWPDFDEAGPGHMDANAAELAQCGVTVVYIIDWRDAPPKGDAADFVAAGGTADEVRALMDGARRFSLEAMLGGHRSTAAQLMDMADRDFRLGSTAAGLAFAVRHDGANVALLLRGGRQSLRGELARAYFAENDRPASSSALADALATLEALALTHDPEILHLRVAGDATEIVLDLGTTDGRCVVIGAESWKVESRSPVLFRRTELTNPLPLPEGGGSLVDLWRFVNVAEVDRPLVLGWLVATLIPEIPHPILLLRGLYGTAKSTTARTLVILLDPSAAPLRSIPANLDDWSVAASGSWVVALDNVSHISEWLSDAMCRAVTGDGLVKRRLYSDDSLAVLSFRRVLALTGIDVGALRGDFVDRLLSVELEPIPPAARMEDAELAVAFRAAHPALFGALLDLTVRVLSALPEVRRDKGWPRMADFARVLAAVDAVLGTEALARYERQARGLAVEVVESDPVAEALLRKVLPGEELKATARDLLKAISPETPPRGWPDTGQKLSGRLRRLVPAMAQLGVEITFDKKGKGRTRIITIKRAAEMPSAEEEDGEAGADHAKAAGSTEEDGDKASAPSAASAPSSNHRSNADASLLSADEPSAQASAGFRDQADAADGADGSAAPSSTAIPSDNFDFLPLEALVTGPDDDPGRDPEGWMP